MLFCRSASRRMPEHLGAALRLAAAHAGLVHAHVREPWSRSVRCRQPTRPPGTADRRRPGRSRGRSGHRVARALARSVCATCLFFRRDRSRPPLTATAMADHSCPVLARRRRRRRRRESLIRIGFSRVCSSSTSALSPATRPMMNSSRPTADGKPRSKRIAASAPSMLSGIGLIASRMRLLRAPARTDAVAGQPVASRQGRRARPRADRSPNEHDVRTREPVDPRCLVSATSSRGHCVERSSRLSRARRGPRDQIHAARAGAAVLVADRQHAGGHRRRQRLAIARRGEPRRRAGRRAGAMVRDADQDARRGDDVRQARAGDRDAAGRSDR